MVGEERRGERVGTRREEWSRANNGERRKKNVSERIKERDGLENKGGTE